MPRKDKSPQLIWRKNRARYYINFTENGRRQERSTNTDNKEKAHRIFADFMYKWERRHGAKEAKDVYILDILSDYAEDKAETAKDISRILYAYKALQSFWADKTIEDINRHSCLEYAKFRNRAVGTINRELSTLRAAINHAVSERRLSHSVPVHLLPKPEARTRWLTKSEAALLLKTALRSEKTRPYLPLFILIGLHTGRRKSAILSLNWDQVDLENQVIYWMVEGETVTTKRKPKSRIPPKLLPHLKRAKRFSIPTAPKGGPVIHRDGKPLKDIKKSFQAACHKIGLTDVTPHVMRHTRATWGMRGGADPWLLSGFLGMSRDTLEAVYGHHHPDFQEDVAGQY